MQICNSYLAIRYKTCMYNSNPSILTNLLVEMIFTSIDYVFLINPQLEIIVVNISPKKRC